MILSAVRCLAKGGNDGICAIGSGVRVYGFVTRGFSAGATAVEVRSAAGPVARVQPAAARQLVHQRGLCVRCAGLHPVSRAEASRRDGQGGSRGLLDSPRRTERLVRIDPSAGRCRCGDCRWLSRDEVAVVLDGIQGVHRVLARLRYGTGKPSLNLPSQIHPDPHRHEKSPRRPAPGASS